MNKRGPKHGVKRGSYVKQASFEARQRVIDAANQGQDWQAIAIANGIKTSTARNWLLRGSADLTPRGNKSGSVPNQKITEECISFIIECLQENPKITLKGLSIKVEQSLHIKVSYQTIAKHMEYRCFTVKKIHYMPDGMNSQANKDKRCQYVNQILQLTGEGKQIIFMDESNVNLFISRTSGRSRKGQRCVVKRPNSHGPNVHMICGISQRGLHNFTRARGSFKWESANTWVRQLFQSLINEGENIENVVLIIDNAPCHSRIENILSEAPFSGARIVRLAPYSAPLNPMEYAWNSIKSTIKNELESRRHLLINGNNEGIGKVEFGLRHLEDIIDGSHGSINMLSCLNYFNHVQRFYAGVLNGNDLIVGQ